MIIKIIIKIIMKITIKITNRQLINDFAKSVILCVVSASLTYSARQGSAQNSRKHELINENTN